MTRCDKCGRFFVYGPGCSWGQTYDHFDLHEASERCAVCTAKRGVPPHNTHPPKPAHERIEKAAAEKEANP